MGAEAKRPLAWEILSNIKSKVSSGATEQTERLNTESEDRRRRRDDRLWWASA